MLEDSMDTLTELAETLPTTQARISDIRDAYDSGRAKVCNPLSANSCVVAGELTDVYKFVGPISRL